MATVSSITPSPAPRWPPVTATASTVSWRSSSASWRSWLLSSRRTSAGVLMRSRRGVFEDWDTREDSADGLGGDNLTGWLKFNQAGPQAQTRNAAKSLMHLAFSTASEELGAPLRRLVYILWQRAAARPAPLERASAKRRRAS